jgi:hypothetical protein
MRCAIKAVRCGSRTHHVLKARRATNARVRAGQLKSPRSPQYATARSLPPHHNHIVPIARDLEVLAGKDTSTTIGSVDGDVAIMRIQQLTGVSRLLPSPNPEGPVPRPDDRFPPPVRLVSRDCNGDIGMLRAGVAPARFRSPNTREASDRLGRAGRAGRHVPETSVYETALLTVAGRPLRRPHSGCGWIGRADLAKRQCGDVRSAGGACHRPTARRRCRCG